MRLTGGGRHQAGFKALNQYGMHVRFLMDYIMAHLYTVVVFAQADGYSRVLTSFSIPVNQTWAS